MLFGSGGEGCSGTVSDGAVAELGATRRGDDEIAGGGIGSTISAIAATGSGSRSCRIVGTSRLLSDFERTFRIPDLRATASTCGDLWRLHKTMGRSGRKCEISFAAENPSLIGMARSRTTMFGRSSTAFCHSLLSVTRLD